MQSHELKEEIVHFMPPPQTCIIYSVACEMPHAFPIVLWAWGYQGISLNGAYFLTLVWELVAVHPKCIRGSNLRAFLSKHMIDCEFSSASVAISI